MPKSSWFAVRCHFLPSLSEGGQTALVQLLLPPQLRAALFTVSVVRAFPLGRAVPGFPRTAQQLTGIRGCWAKSSKGKKTHYPKIIMKKELMFSSGKQEAFWSPHSVTGE